MEVSPLTQQTRPETFQPKVVELYQILFAEEDEEFEFSEGFWRELFLLRPDPPSLRRILDPLSGEDLLHLQERSQQLFSRAITAIESGNPPSDEVALDVRQQVPSIQPDRLTNKTLTAFLAQVLPKKYNSPSADIISVLAGLDDADSVFTDFVGALDHTIRNGRNGHVRLKAFEAALSLTSGAYQTGLVSYFTHRDLFPALMKFAQDVKDPSELIKPFVLLGLLTNYNKFEFQNPYRLRLDDFVNDSTIKKIVQAVGYSCTVARNKYVVIQDDTPEGWTLSSTLTFIGLGSFAPGARHAPPTLTAEEANKHFAMLPGPEAATLLATFDFVNANKLFCFNLVTLPASTEGMATPFSELLSFCSYLFQHAHRKTRAAQYTYLVLFILQIIIEDPTLAKRICSEDSKSVVRLCRQRPPYLPFVRGERIQVGVIMDVMVDGINHNLRRRLDVQFYILCLGILLRIISFLHMSRIRLTYHWSELWRSLLSFIRFLTTYANDLKALPGIYVMIDRLVNIIALSLSGGESFLPDPHSYDDLFYKLVETGDNLVKFRDTYELGKRASSESIQILISVSNHYYSLLEGEEKGKVRSKNLSPREVSKVIRQGYETLSIQAKEGLDHWDRFREADHKSDLKKIARIAVEDAKELLDTPHNI